MFIKIISLFILMGSFTLHAAEGLLDRDPQLALDLVKNKNGLLIDVRNGWEYIGGSIEGAKNLPIQSFKDSLPMIEKWTHGNKDQPIVVFCAVGGRAAKAKEILLEAGYTQVTNLGSKDDWPAK